MIANCRSPHTAATPEGGPTSIQLAFTPVRGISTLSRLYALPGTGTEQAESAYSATLNTTGRRHCALTMAAPRTTS